MAAYSSTLYGPPRSGRFAVGDTLTDAGGLIWRCVKAVSPRQWVLVTDPGSGGAPNTQTGLTVTEQGNEAVKKTKFTFDTNWSLAVPNATQTSGAGVKIYTFPEGRFIVLGVQGSLTWRTISAEASTLNTGSTAVWSAGSAVASSTTLASTMADFLASSSVTTAGTGVAYTVSNQSNTTAFALDGTGGAKSLYLNFGVATDASLDADATVGAVGYITVLWTLLGDY